MARLVAGKHPSVVQRNPRRRRIILSLVVLAALVFFAIGDDGLYQIWKARNRLAESQQVLSRLQAENDSLKQVLWQLHNDMAYVERTARERYGMVKKGERVYRLRSSTVD